MHADVPYSSFQFSFQCFAQDHHVESSVEFMYYDLYSLEDEYLAHTTHPLSF